MCMGLYPQISSESQKIRCPQKVKNVFLFSFFAEQDWVGYLDVFKTLGDNNAHVYPAVPLSAATCGIQFQSNFSSTFL